MSKQGDPLAYRNENLFSDYFLREILPEDDKWKEEWEVGAEELSEKLEFITNLYRKHKDVIRGWQEQDVRDKFINPILREVLGFEFITRSSTSGIPDYALYLNDTDYKDASTGRVEDPFSKAVVGEAKRWELPLDDRSPRSPGLFDTHSPDYQTRMYVLTNKVRWGVLTNGRIWRLYNEATANKHNVYYEVDILSFVGQQRTMFADFRYFYLFFRAAAFQKGGFLDKVLYQSIEQFRGIGEDLEQNVYRALRILAQGFFDNKNNKLNIKDEEHIRKVHDNCLIFLYRILFILYAESLRHLPVDVEYYNENFSLNKLKHEIDKVIEHKSSKEYLRDDWELWGRLQKLFILINEGSEKRGIPKAKLSIPAYNGGLFKPEVHEFLENHSVDDKTLSQVIDLLARGRTPASPVKRFINYKELGVTKLGGIYEGLLENKLRIADDDMVPTRGKKQMWLPLSEVGKQKIIDNEKVEKGQLYPVTDKGERKATGSYYTPDYIVRYIVDHTLGPLCERAAGEVEALRPGIEKRIKKLRKDAEKKGESQKKIDKAVEEIQFELVEPYLRLKVLDPAMGSGHFLVYATRYIGERIRDDKNVAEVIPEHSDDEVFWMRRVVERSIFGVDLNYLAVELAKLALWLETFSKDAPLSFLDHHLRQGNSLIGASVEQLKALFPKARKAKDTKQLDAFELAFSENLRKAVASYKSIETLTTDTIERVKEKERDLETARTLMRRFRELGDVATSTWFGNTVKDKDYQDMFNSLSSDETWDKVIRGRDWFKEANSQWHEASPKFFHWELEFPEVFFDDKGNNLKEEAGFDAIIGNPPYVRAESQSKKFKKYTESKYEAYAGSADLYVYFIEQAHHLLSTGGRFGMITSNKYIRANYGKGITHFIKYRTKLDYIVDFGELPVFPEAATFPSIILTQNIETKEQHFIHAPVKRLSFKSLDEEVKSIGKELDNSALGDEGWTLGSGEEVSIFEKMKKRGVPLGEYVDGKIYYGIKTGFNEAFVIDRETRDRMIAEDSKSAEIIKPFVVGDDVRKYRIEFDERYLILTKIGVPIDKYPAIYKHLKKYQDKLETRWDKGEQWWELRPCDYYSEFEKPKIIFPDIAKESRFTFDSNNIYVTNTAYILPVNDLYLLGLLNSKLIFTYYKRTAMVLGDPDKKGRLRWIYQYVTKIPIKDIKLSKASDTKMHDDMVNLVQWMLDLNKRKQAITRNYIAWLESVIGAKVSDLSGKDALSAPENLKDIGELIKLLNKNRSKLTTFDPKVYRDLEKLTANFEECKKDLDPVVAEIEKTDREIDCLVYKLYGLTPEEIEIVESRPNPCQG